MAKQGIQNIFIVLCLILLGAALVSCTSSVGNQLIDDLPVRAEAPIIPQVTPAGRSGFLPLVMKSGNQSPAATETPTPTPTVTYTPPPNSPAYPLKASPNGRYLVDQNNVPFLIIGDSPQEMSTMLSIAQMDSYLMNRSKAGINAGWFNILAYCCGQIDTYDGIAPFTRPNDLSTPNEAYFSRIDSMLNLAAQYGIVAFLDPIDSNTWLPTLRSNGKTKAFNYGVYLGNRYKNFPNIIWLNGNDFQTWSDPNDDELVSAVAKGIKSVDTNHLQTVELNYDTSGSLDDPTWAPIIGLDAAYSYYPQYAQVLKEYNRADMPVWFVEGVYEFQDYEGGYLGPYQLRNQEYWTQLSGSTGQLYGNANLYSFGRGWDASGWDTTPGVVQFGYMARFFSQFPWYDLVPDQKHSVVTAGYGTFQDCCVNANSDYLTAARTPDGKLVIAYMPTRRTITVNMAQMSGSVTARWYDPTNGTFVTVSGSPFPNNGSRLFTPPGKNSAGDGDWVIVLEAN